MAHKEIPASGRMGMKEVTLYTAKKKQVLSYDMQNIRQYNYLDISVPIRHSNSFINKREIEDINIPVQRFCWQDDNGFREIYAAFDQELLELIGCSQEKFKNDVNQAADRLVNQKYSELIDDKIELEKLQSMNTWAAIRWIFKRIWK